ncbi:unnamed protein product [Lupinus luteus]|uniref:Uncharacterized protein n=1 Tax=Lupinus luteus TaxID=3873 RepID=A0AAV1X695_LUPLU
MGYSAPNLYVAQMSKAMCHGALNLTEIVPIILVRCESSHSVIYSSGMVMASFSSVIEYFPLVK